MKEAEESDFFSLFVCTEYLNFIENMVYYNKGGMLNGE
jgi:hypothetical protein